MSQTPDQTSVQTPPNASPIEADLNTQTPPNAFGQANDRGLLRSRPSGGVEGPLGGEAQTPNKRLSLKGVWSFGQTPTATNRAHVDASDVTTVECAEHDVCPHARGYVDRLVLVQPRVCRIPPRPRAWRSEPASSSAY
jgi:hypothetical protein